MSVSEMNMSWSTASAQLSTKSLESSTFITAVSKDGKEVRRKPVSYFVVLKPRAVRAMQTFDVTPTLKL